MTFSIVGRSADGAEMGVAVASKFLAAGAYVPAAAARAGALATQAHCNLELRTRGLEMLAAGRPQPRADRVLRRRHPAGAAPGRASSMPRAAPPRSRASGANRGPGVSPAPIRRARRPGQHAGRAEVVDAMVEAWLAGPDQPVRAGWWRRCRPGRPRVAIPGRRPPPCWSCRPARLRRAVRRARRPAQRRLARTDRGPGAHARPPRPLLRSTPDEDLLPLEGPAVGELEERLAATGYRSGDVIRDLYDWMGRENSRSAGATASSIRSCSTSSAGPRRPSSARRAQGVQVPLGVEPVLPFLVEDAQQALRHRVAGARASLGPPPARWCWPGSLR